MMSYLRFKLGLNGLAMVAIVTEMFLHPGYEWLACAGVLWTGMGMLEAQWLERQGPERGVLHVLTFIPPRRVCGSKEKVLIFDDNDLEATICPECCGKVKEHPDGEAGHQFEYMPEEGEHSCKYCGLLRATYDNFDDNFDDINDNRLTPG